MPGGETDTKTIAQEPLFLLGQWACIPQSFHVIPRLEEGRPREHRVQRQDKGLLCLVLSVFFRSYWRGAVPCQLPVDLEIDEDEAGFQVE